MDWRPPLRLKLLLCSVFLPTSTNVVQLHGNPLTGVNHNLTCVNDYLHAIQCSLSIAPSGSASNSSSSYWLSFTETSEQKTFQCMLTNTKEGYVCSKRTSDVNSDAETFTDTDTYEILLCHNHNNGSEICELLNKEYSPVENIKPNPPCCLTVRHNSSQYHFTWKSTYETYSTDTDLPDNLQYELHYYKRGTKHEKPPNVNTDDTNFSADDENFVADSEYAARVRSSPNMQFYCGVWSDWSSEVHWKTERAMNGLQTNTFMSEMGKKVLIPMCVLVLLILLMCYARLKRWRQSAFIPTPAPYFHTLYSHYKGDFKSWVVTQENTADMLKAEETLQIDTLTKCADVQEEECPPQFHQQSMEASAYSNITGPGCDAALLGIPYAVNTVTPPSAHESSLTNLTPGTQSGSPDGDSGYWFCSDTSLEKNPVWYCNEYCTLSTLQLSGSVRAGHHGSSSTKPCQAEVIKVGAAEEA